MPKPTLEQQIYDKCIILDWYMHFLKTEDDKVNRLRILESIRVLHMEIEELNKQLNR